MAQLSRNHPDIRADVENPTARRNVPGEFAGQLGLPDKPQGFRWIGQVGLV
jgi:hypothetical protein